MAKKKHHKSRPSHPNASSRAPHVPRAPRTPDEKRTERLMVTALGAAGTALVCGFLAKPDWSLKVITMALTAVGDAVAASGKTTQLQAVVTGASGAGAGPCSPICTHRA